MTIDFKFNAKNNTRGFTLIELLLVIAIVGLLTSVVLVSLQSARSKAQAAFVVSSLRNMIPQSELMYDSSGNFSTVCSDSKTVNTVTTISNTGLAVSCFSYNNAGFSDVYMRWGISAIKGITTPLKAYTVSQNGAGIWDNKGVDSIGSFIPNDTTMTWSTAMTACFSSGGRLPTLEELKSLTDAVWIFSSSTTRTPPGFATGDYWSSIAVPSTTSTSYVVSMTTGNISTNLKTVFNSVRCVR